MYCSKCGTRLEEGDLFCYNCGSRIEEKPSVDSNYAGSQPTYFVPQNQPSRVGENENKAGIGVLMALFLGLIGLIIGVCIYNSGTEERRTFINGF